MKTFSKSPGQESLRDIDCALCGGSSYDRWNGASSLFVQCRRCGLIFQNPQPVLDELVDRYDDQYYEYEIANEGQFFGLMELGLADIGFDSIESALPTGNRSFLDIGCATGLLISRMKANGWREQGVEVCRPAAEHGIRERGVRIFVGTLEQAAFPAASFDVVHCSHLIEHLTDPTAFVWEVARILKPDGHFIVTTPNADGFQARLFGSEWRSMIPDHMYLFSKRTLGALLKRHGYQVLRMGTWGGLAVGTAPKPVKVVFDRLAKKWGFGDVMICLARKANTDGTRVFAPIDKS